MKKRYLTPAIIGVVLASMTMTSCIGSFRLTHSVLKWNQQVGSKVINEIVFFAFWVLPVYEVTSLADLLVINSIEFWSGRNPLTASVKVVDTDHGRYTIACDSKGYEVTNTSTGVSYRLDFMEATATWALDYQGVSYPLMTMVDENHVKAVTPSGDFRLVELSDEGLQAYAGEVFAVNPGVAMAFGE
ncbi:MAG: DUF3332 domain-containing protein [Bacteroides sp.]|nr:DUF3332 domain-containing protein [Bacteroides sp.]